MGKTPKKNLSSQTQNSETPIIIGWSDVNELAREIWCSVHNILLRGELLFAYKNRDNFQFVLVRNNNYDYAIGMITSGYTMLLPHIPNSYLGDFSIDLKNSKADKSIIDIYNKIIEDLKK